MQHKNMDFVQYCARKLVDWYTRVKTLPRVLMQIGVTLLTLTYVSGWLNLQIETSLFTLHFNDSDTPGYISLSSYLLGAILLITGVAIGIWEHVTINKQSNIIVLEQRGLNFAPETRLKEAIRKHHGGGIIDIDCDIRSPMSQGRLQNPRKALARVQSSLIELETKAKKIDINNIKIFYGGIMPVPFTFFTGMSFDDESNTVETYDWERNNKEWKPLNDIDDGNRFTVTGLENISNEKEIIVAVSGSYKIDFESVETTLKRMPIVHLDLQDSSIESHWSKEKQDELCKSFSKTLFDIKSAGVRKVHLFVTAANSVCFNLGRAYDARNFPEALIYQYEQSSTPPFPWALKLPTHGIEESIVEIKKAD